MLNSCMEYMHILGDMFVFSELTFQLQTHFSLHGPLIVSPPPQSVHPTTLSDLHVSYHSNTSVIGTAYYQSMKNILHGIQGIINGAERLMTPTQKIQRIQIQDLLNTSRMLLPLSHCAHSRGAAHAQAAYRRIVWRLSRIPTEGSIRSVIRRSWVRVPTTFVWIRNYH